MNNDHDLWCQKYAPKKNKNIVKLNQQKRIGEIGI